jgi:hypothetical protein
MILRDRLAPGTHSSAASPPTVVLGRSLISCGWRWLPTWLVHDDDRWGRTSISRTSGPRSRATPLIITHGWPGSIVKFTEINVSPRQNLAAAVVLLAAAPGNPRPDRAGDRGPAPSRTILVKLGATSRTEAVAIAHRAGLAAGDSRRPGPKHGLAAAAPRTSEIGLPHDAGRPP